MGQRGQALCMPSFFVIGPPRTGTSWLHEVLNQHTVLPSLSKETRFFDSHCRRGFHWYSSHFRHRCTGQPVGEITPFAQAPFGAAHISEDAQSVGLSQSDTSFATALGGGIDYKLFAPIAWRFQGDLLQTRYFSNTQNNLRLSTGIVLRF
jgi:hypothetical protein